MSTHQLTVQETLISTLAFHVQPATVESSFVDPERSERVVRSVTTEASVLVHCFAHCLSHAVEMERYGKYFDGADASMKKAP